LHTNRRLLRPGKTQHNAKKKTFAYAEKSERERAEFAARLKRVPQNKRVYVDESGVHTCLQREYARAPRGETIEETTQGKKFERVNVTGALCGGKHSAIECCSQTANSGFFEGRFKNNLLEEIPNGCTVIMDNASFHRKKELRKIARGRARLLFLPPYSPDYNPIEKTWANMKRFLCNHLKEFKSVDIGIYNYFWLIDN
jgi:hypothetical protein